MAATKFVYVGATDERARAEVEGPMTRYFQRIGNIFGPRDGSATRRLAPLDGATTRSRGKFVRRVRAERVARRQPGDRYEGLKAYEAEGIPQMRLWFTFGPGCHTRSVRSLAATVHQGSHARAQPAADLGSRERRLGSEAAA